MLEAPVTFNWGAAWKNGGTEGMIWDLTLLHPQEMALRCLRGFLTPMVTVMQNQSLRSEMKSASRASSLLAAISVNLMVRRECHRHSLYVAMKVMIFGIAIG